MTPNEFADQASKVRKVAELLDRKQGADQASITPIVQRRLANSVGELKLLSDATLIFIKTNKATLGI
jgi:hypothetical protein